VRWIILSKGIAGTRLVVIAVRQWASPLIATLDARWPMALPAPLQWLGGLLMLGALDTAPPTTGLIAQVPVSVTGA
jgi:hypothetical protein